MPFSVFLYTPIYNLSLLLNRLTPIVIFFSRLTWTVIPQGFIDGSHLFGNALARELMMLQFNMGASIQFVDNLLVASPTKRDLDKNIKFLNVLGADGYRIPLHKAHISIQEFKYLGYGLTPATRAIALE